MLVHKHASMKSRKGYNRIIEIKPTMMSVRKIKGFTLIEILLVIAIMAILAAIVIVAINPAKQFGEAQNVQRQSDVRALLDAVIQYSLDNSGTPPSGIPVGTTCNNDGELICQVDVVCDGVFLDSLVAGRTYLTDLPTDPTAGDAEITGYSIMQNSSGRVSVCAKTTYNEVDITVTK